MSQIYIFIFTSCLSNTTYCMFSEIGADFLSFVFFRELLRNYRVHSDSSNEEVLFILPRSSSVSQEMAALESESDTCRR
jgi:hypothetical protein